MSEGLRYIPACVCIVIILVVLDLSAAFDTIDHSILCRRLGLSFGIRGLVLAWFQSYLHGRSQYVRRDMHLSSSSAEFASLSPRPSLVYRVHC